MLTTHPLTDAFCLAYAADSAFDVDRYAVDGKPTDESMAKYLEEFERCVETQDYEPLCKPGEKPTLFWFRPVKHSEADIIIGLNLGPAASTAIFRMCLRSIDDPALGQVELKRTADPKLPGLGNVLSIPVLDSLVARTRDFDFVHFLGNYVFSRSRATAPKR